MLFVTASQGDFGTNLVKFIFCYKSKFEIKLHIIEGANNELWNFESTMYFAELEQGRRKLLKVGWAIAHPAHLSPAPHAS